MIIMTRKRTDIHRPTTLDPEAYDYLGTWDLYPDYPSPADTAYRLRVINEQIAQGHRFGGAHGHGYCDHCGTRIRYASLMLHRPTGQMIWIGEQCLDNRFELATDEFQRLRKEAKLNRERMKKADKIAAVVDAHPLLAWLTYPSYTNEVASQFIFDLGDKFRRYGELSDRQIESVETAIVRQTARDDKIAARQAEDAKIAASGVRVPEGRQTITAEIVSIKEKDTDFGITWKVLLRSADGWKVYATLPTNLSDWALDQHREDWFDALLHRTVTMTVTIKPSDDDPLFGFGSRPTKAKIV